MTDSRNGEKPKIALVYDRVVKFGGAERVLLSLHKLYPDAPLYTAIYDRNKAPWADSFEVRTSFLKHLPLADRYHEMLPFLTPYAFENFDFSDFDIVLSVTSSDAKSIITKPGTLHICYCLTPTRYLWSGYNEYLAEPGVGLLNPLFRAGMRLFAPALRRWDLLSAKRPDTYLAISETVKKRLSRFYREKAEVVYPPLDTGSFSLPDKKTRGDYFLIVSRLVPYKGLDYAISLFSKTGQKLVVIGSGVDNRRLQNLAGNSVKFITGNLTDRKLCWYYQNCRSLIFPGEEDFGLTAVEAQACGSPVIALALGGAAESIRHGQTGLLYGEKTEASLENALRIFETMEFNPRLLRENAIRFSEAVFMRKMKAYILRKWRKEQSV
ncbi:MAG: group 1 glycosyl transferase [Candidatus Gottesmanbacteria bacterium GW2011_GWA2_43_14]|uniref:Group 1 glycosyl transferase n=1 Tax=Candidatus Gottesmanbacteria bacterium GW2011_GWA2_43_14 TaxID=1618443 RepID=A0A0G1GIK8_9BACT|nr:MAG: group 1 glycosyl transferase [Candidatus Gottesmanbacteria bacterium GW2011_GWA2_43_14]